MVFGRFGGKFRSHKGHSVPLSPYTRSEHRCFPVSAHQTTECKHDAIAILCRSTKISSIRDEKLMCHTNSESPNAALNHERSPRTSIFSSTANATALLLDDNRLETLGVLDVDGLDVAVQLLLGALLVVTSPRDADAEPEWAALDTLLPDLLVQLGVDPDVGGAL